MTQAYFSNQLLEGARNCVLNCGGVTEGDNVLILSLMSDPNDIVEDRVIHVLSTVAQEAGAKVTVMSTAGMVKGWWDDVPSVVLGAIENADVILNNTYGIGRPVKAVREAIVGRGIVNVGSKARTDRILSSEWARFPFNLSDGIARLTGKVLDKGARWRVVAENGTDISGTIGPAPVKGRGAASYAQSSAQRAYRPFPIGFFPVVTALDTSGVIVTQNIPPWEARHLGIPELSFSEPMRVLVEDNKIVKFEGGREADVFQRFYESLVEHIGGDAWNLMGWHAGTHPKSRVTDAASRYPDIWHAGYHTNPRVMHFHLGGSALREYDYPYTCEISCHVEHATIFVDDVPLYDGGHLTILDLEETRDLASQFGNPDELLTEVFFLK